MSRRRGSALGEFEFWRSVAALIELPEFLDKDGRSIASMLDLNGVFSLPPYGAPGVRGARWGYRGREISIRYRSWVDVCPTPALDGVVVYGFAPSTEAGSDYPPPDNAIIVNADGSFRLQLKCPSLLARYVPGYNMPERHIRPWGFSQIRSGSFGFENRFTMLANITIADTDCYETRYFDPDTGEFDPEHYDVWRR